MLRSASTCPSASWTSGQGTVLVPRPPLSASMAQGQVTAGAQTLVPSGVARFAPTLGFRIRAQVRAIVPLRKLRSTSHPALRSSPGFTLVSEIQAFAGWNPFLRSTSHSIPPLLRSTTQDQLCAPQAGTTVQNKYRSRARSPKNRRSKVISCAMPATRTRGHPAPVCQLSARTRSPRHKPRQPQVAIG